ncbi:hypothetical protein HYX09_05080 [Candidatus Woesearchaeota archaeon]|nr:hypothetical protein [Candidatus Woesearchaeota archaeon]
MNKDILMAIMVPVIVIAGLFFSDDSVTGFAASVKPEQKNAFGEYLLDPSFNAGFDYAMQEGYADAVEIARGIVSKCKDRRKPGDCLRIEAVSNGYVCGKNDPEDIFYDFIERYTECMELEQEDAVCRFSPKKLAVDAGFRKAFQITARNEAEGVSFELREGDDVLVEDFIGSGEMSYVDFDGRNSPNKVDYVNVDVDYTNEIPIISGIKDNAGKEFSTHSLYKNGGKVMFIEKSVENNFIVLNSAYLPKKRGTRFCIKSGKTVDASDPADDEVKPREVTYRFVVTHPESGSVPPVTSFDAEDKLKAENSAMILWDKVLSGDGTELEDFDHYNVYCSEAEFERDEGGIRLEGLEPVMISSGSNPQKWKASIDICNGRKMSDGSEYFFTITAVAGDSESDAVASRRVVPSDDLSPGITRYNIANGEGLSSNSADGSACIKLKSYISLAPPVGSTYAPIHNEDNDLSNAGTLLRTGEPTFQLHFSRGEGSNILDNLDACNKEDCISVTGSQRVSFNDGSKAGEVDFADGDTYCFTLTAKDGNGNVIKKLGSPYRFDKPEQWQGLEYFQKTP